MWIPQFFPQVGLVADSAPSPPANAAEEYFVRQSPLYEVVGQLGMWGTLINGVQAAALEHDGMVTATWNGTTGESPLSAILVSPLD